MYHVAECKHTCSTKSFLNTVYTKTVTHFRTTVLSRFLVLIISCKQLSTCCIFTNIKAVTNLIRCPCVLMVFPIWSSCLWRDVNTWLWSWKAPAPLRSGKVEYGYGRRFLVGTGHWGQYVKAVSDSLVDQPDKHKELVRFLRNFESWRSMMHEQYHLQQSTYSFCFELWWVKVESC